MSDDAKALEDLYQIVAAGKKFLKFPMLCVGTKLDFRILIFLFFHLTSIRIVTMALEIFPLFIDDVYCQLGYRIFSLGRSVSSYQEFR